MFNSTPVWNLRLLPFWYLGLILLAMLGAAEPRAAQLGLRSWSAAFGVSLRGTRGR